VRVSTGLSGLDEMVQGGLPLGSAVVLQGPPGQEKMRLALTFLADGLKAGASGLVVIASQSPDSVLTELRNLGVDLDAVVKENRLRIVDWYSQREEPVQDVEDRGVVLRSSIDLTNVGVALSRAIAALGGDKPKRAVVELLSPAASVYEVSQVYAFAQSSKGKFARFNYTALVLLEKEMHAGSELSTLHQPFDGVIELERVRLGDEIVRKIGVLHLKDTTPDTAFRVLEMSEDGLRIVREAPQKAPPGPGPKPPASRPSSPPSSARVSVTPETPEESPTRAYLIMQIARERLKLNADDADALFATAAAQATLDDVRGALEALQRLSKVDDRYPGLWVLKTKLHARLGQVNEARVSRKRAEETEAAELEAAEIVVACPLCETPVSENAARCPKCGAKFLEEEDIADELDALGQVAIQEKVQEELRAKDLLTGSEGPARPAPSRPAPPKPTPAPQVTAPPKESPKPSPRKGMTNGLVKERGPRTAGMTNGLRGRTNGLTNGLRGRTNGLTNGLRGRTNGLTNGLGRTNGLTNGMGRANGLTNGLGRTNGVTNGLTNGLVSLRRGLTNGLTNGNGFTNGLGSPRFQREIRLNRWKLYVIPVVAVALLLVPLFTPPDYRGRQYPIQIDGAFEDWAAVTGLALAPEASLDPDVDFVRVAVTDNVDFLSFYAEVRGNILSGEPGGAQTMDALFIFIDVDGSPSTGYRVQGLGADRLIEISGWSGWVASALLREFDANADPDDWSGWIKAAKVTAVALGARVEFQADWLELSDRKGTVDVAFASLGWDGQRDVAEATATSAPVYVRVGQDTQPPQIVAGNAATLARLSFTAVGGDVPVRSLNLSLEGTFAPSSLSALSLVDESGSTLAQRVVVGPTVTFDLPAFTVLAGQTLSLFVRPTVAMDDGTTLGAYLAGPRDVVAGGVSFIAPPTAPEGYAYVGAIPVGARVDGGLAEWPGPGSDPVGDGQGGPDPDRDIVGFGLQSSGGSTYFLLHAGGTALNGTLVPTRTGPFVVSPPGQADSDRDTVPDVDDVFDYDFNNNGIADAASGNDYDGDGFVDYGFMGGTDLWLNTTIPGTYPVPYAGRVVSVYIGPVARPEALGEDAARLYLDDDGSAVTGYSVGGIGADYLIEITGKNGRILTSLARGFNGSNPGIWSWSSLGPAPAMKDRSRLETALPGVPSTNASRVFIELSAWTGARDDILPAPPTRLRAATYNLETLGVMGDISTGTGGAAGDAYGFNVTGVGKVNEASGGYEDFVIGAPYVDLGGQNDRGAIYLFFGSASWSPANINAGSANVVIYGGAAGDHFGWAVAGAGDVNGDSIADILVGSPDTSAGTAYLIYGRTDWTAANGASVTSVASVVTIAGQTSGDKFGSGVAGLGNLDNSGSADFAVGAPGYSSNKGRAYIFYGDGSVPTSAVNSDVRLDGGATGDKFGSSVAAAGNVNNDAYQDLIVGAPGTSKAYVYTLAISSLANGAFASDATGWTYSEVDPNGYDSGAWENTGGSTGEFSGAGSHKFTFTDTSSSLTLYFHAETVTVNTASGRALSSVTTDGAQASTTTVSPSASGDHLLIGTWTTPVLGITTLPAGTWTFTYNADKGGGITDGHIDVHIYKRSSGGTLTSIDGTDGQDTTDGVAASAGLTTSPADYSATYSMSQQSFATTDALVIKVYGHAVTVGSGTKKITFNHDASSANSRVITTAASAEIRFFHSETATINTFNTKQLLTTSPDQGTTQTSSAAFSSVGHTFVGEFSTPQLGITSIPAGDWHFYYWGYWTGGAAASATMHFDVHIYKRSSSGTLTSVDGTDGLNATNGVADSGDVIQDTVSSLYSGSVNLGAVSVTTTDAIVVRVYAHITAVAGNKNVYFDYDTASKASRMVYPGVTRTDRLSIASTSAFTSPPGTYSSVRHRIAYSSTVGSIGDAFYKVKLEVRNSADSATVATAFDSGSLTTAQSWALQTGTVSGLSASTSYKMRASVEIFNVHASQTPSITVNVDDIALQFEIVTTLTGTASANFGWSVSKAGNVNNDAAPYGDVLVGAPGETNGKAFLFYGAASFDSTVDVTITGAASGDRFGYSVSAAGDSNGDGIDDLVIGAPYYDDGAKTDAGAVYVFAGSASLASSLAATDNIAYRYGQTANDHLGWSVSYSNPDGTNPTEIIAGAPHFDAGANTDAGKAYVLRIPEFGEIAIPLLGAILPVIVFRRVRRRRHAAA